MNNRDKYEKLQKLSDRKHLQNLLKILHFDFWSDDERLFFVWMYVKVIIKNLHWDNRSTAHVDYLERLFDILRS